MIQKTIYVGFEDNGNYGSLSVRIAFESKQEIADWVAMNKHCRGFKEVTLFLEPVTKE